MVDVTDFLAGVDMNPNRFSSDERVFLRVLPWPLGLHRFSLADRATHGDLCEI
jgi:hypothetical protein